MSAAGAVAFVLLVACAEVHAEELTVGGGLGLSVAADGKNPGVGLGMQVIGDYGLLRKGPALAQVYAAALWTTTDPHSCGPQPTNECLLSARLALAGVKGRIHVHSYFFDLGVGVGAGTIVTSGGMSRAARSDGAAPHVLLGFGYDLIGGFALSADYLYFPTANQLTGGVSLLYRVRPPPQPDRRMARP